MKPDDGPLQNDTDNKEGVEKEVVENEVVDTYTAIESVHDADAVSSYDESNDDDDDTPIYDDPPVTPHGGTPP